LASVLRSAVVALAALFFYHAQVFINLHQTIFVDLLANSTQYQLYGSTEFSGSAVKQESYTSREIHFGRHTILTTEMLRRGWCFQIF